MTLTDFSERTNRPNLSDVRPPRNKFHPAQECQTRGGKGEELRLQSQEGQELSAGVGASQLIGPPTFLSCGGRDCRSRGERGCVV